MPVRHQKEPGEGQADFLVYRLDALHQSMHGDAVFRQQLFAGRPQRSRDKADLAPVAMLKIVNVEGPMIKDAVVASTRSFPIGEEAVLARHKIEPVGIGFQERNIPLTLGADLVNDTVLQFRSARLPLFAFDARLAR